MTSPRLKPYWDKVWDSGACHGSPTGSYEEKPCELSIVLLGRKDRFYKVMKQEGFAKVPNEDNGKCPDNVKETWVRCLHDGKPLLKFFVVTSLCEQMGF